jgi:hypothetical protein
MNRVFLKIKKIIQKNKDYKIEDMSELFIDSKDQDYVDHVHYTPVAQYKIAKKLSEEIGQNLTCN